MLQNANTIAIEQMIMVGNQLLDLVIPQYIQSELRTSGLFLEIGVDEVLLEYPWELMHDGDNFMCLKHFVGRFVNAASPMIPLRERTMNWVGSALDKLSILLISVPNPQPRGSVIYDRLPEAEAETKAILDILNGTSGVKFDLISGKQATFNNVYQALKSGHYHIVHFNGHAHSNDKEPHRSGLVLYDRDMTTGPIVSFFGRTPPIFCFINACETGRATLWKNRYNIFELARAFLESGTYLLGSRWKLSDSSASEFATKFYSSLIKDGKSLGNAITVARNACRGASPLGDFGWASYVFYGDPRICFRRLRI